MKLLVGIIDIVVKSEFNPSARTERFEISKHEVDDLDYYFFEMMVSSHHHFP